MPQGPINPTDKNADPQNSATNPPVNSNTLSEESEINLLDLLLVLARRWKLIVSVPCAVAIISALYSLSIPNIYTAKAMILASEDQTGGMMSQMAAQMGGLAPLAGGGFGAPTKTDLYISLLKSETVKDQIIDRYNLMSFYKAKFRTDLYASLGGAVIITAGKKDGIITIAVNNKAPKTAAIFANAYVEELGKLLVRLNVTGAGKNRLYLEERLTKARADLATAEDSLKSFQTKNKVVAATDQAKSTLESVALLRARLNAEEVRLATLRQQYSDASQPVKSARTAISALNSQIDRMEGSSSGGSIPGVGSIPQLGQEYMRLMREFKIQENLVELLAKQYESTKLSEAKGHPPFQVLQKAKTPERKSKPKRSRIVILSAVTTFFLMIFAVFLHEYVQKINDGDRQRLQELRRLLPLPRRLRKPERL